MRLRRLLEAKPGSQWRPGRGGLAAESTGNQEALHMESRCGLCLHPALVPSLGTQCQGPGDPVKTPSSSPGPRPCR